MSQYTGIVYAFNVGVPSGVKEKASLAGVPLLSFNVIYRFIDSLKQQLTARLRPVEETVVIGEWGGILNESGGGGGGPIAYVSIYCLRYRRSECTANLCGQQRKEEATGGRLQVQQGSTGQETTLHGAEERRSRPRWSV